MREHPFSIYRVYGFMTTADCSEEDQEEEEERGQLEGFTEVCLKAVSASSNGLG